MPRIPRNELIDPTEVGIFHCINRCVRRAFLCGDDPFSGKNYDHRKVWLQDRLQFLAGFFGIDLLGFAILSNHFHLIVRIRPDVVTGWTDDDVARRWWNLFPARKNDDGSPAEPEAHELQRITADAPKLAEIRRRLSSLSWFMRCLVETIARRANRDDQATGRFWKGASYYLHFPCSTGLRNVDVERFRVESTPQVNLRSAVEDGLARSAV